MSAGFLFNESINLYLQSNGSPAVDLLFRGITYAGSQPAYLFLTSVIFWCFSKRTGVRLMYVILFSSYLSILAKNLFAMPRPPESLHKVNANGFGFPSAHAQVSASFWGYLAGRIKNRWLIPAGVAAVMLVSLSRIYLGVHYTGDVIGGIIFGLIFSVLCLKAEPGIVNKIQSLDIVSKYIVALLIPAVLLVIAEVQLNNITEQFEIVIVVAAVSTGYLLEEEHIGFEDAKNNAQRIRRIITGVIVLVLVYLAAGFFIKSTVFGYAVTGLTSTFIVPWFFTAIEKRPMEKR